MSVVNFANNVSPFTKDQALQYIASHFQRQDQKRWDERLQQHREAKKEFYRKQILQTPPALVGVSQEKSYESVILQRQKDFQSYLMNHFNATVDSRNMSAQSVPVVYRSGSAF